jgi:hypothetical protein
MAATRSTNMDEKAANHGDRMKHALLLETLKGTHGWPTVTYAETHAGAGIYRAEGQAAQEPDQQYIRLLREGVNRVCLPTESDRPGASYLEWLKEWWKDASNDGTYPGSGLTALRWLKRHRQPEQFEIRLTEGEKEPCERLRGALGIPEDRVKHGSFNVYLDWLTASDNLILLIDPFGIVKEFEQGAGDCGLGRGWIDHEIVTKILDRCVDKKRAIVHFWWSSGQGFKQHCAATSQLFKAWRSEHRDVVHRDFHDNHNHKSTLFGIGAGGEIVSGLPCRESWNGSWLRDVIYEKPCKKSK